MDSPTRTVVSILMRVTLVYSLIYLRASALSNLFSFFRISLAYPDNFIGTTNFGALIKIRSTVNETETNFTRNKINDGNRSNNKSQIL